jgi:hypothetical protein
LNIKSEISKSSEEKTALRIWTIFVYKQFRFPLANHQVIFRSPGFVSFRNDENCPQPTLQNILIIGNEPKEVLGG